jgi:lambda family phage tail tape measure protein
MANFIGRLGVLLGLDSAEFQKGIQQASRQLDSFVDKAKTTATVGATAFAAMTYQAMQLADEIVDTAKANDMAVDSILKLRNALAQNGGEAENAGKLLASFTNFVDNAAQGSFEAQKTFKTLGVSLNDLRTMSIDQLFLKATDGLQKMEDPLTRNAKAMEVFGKAAKGVDFANLRKDFVDGAGVTDEQAQAIEAAAEAFDTLEKAGRNFSIMLASELGPSIKTTLEYFGDIQGEGNLVGKALKTTFDTVVIVGANVAFVIKGMLGELVAMYDFVDNLVNKGLATAVAKNEEYVKRTIAARKELDDFVNRILNGGNGAGAGGSAGSGSSGAGTGGKGSGRTVKPGVDKEAEALKKKQLDLFLKGFAEEQRQREENNKLIAEQETLYQKGNAAEMERQRIASVEIDRTKEMLDLTFKGRSMRAEDLQLSQELKEVEWKRLDAIERINSSQVLDADARKAALERENALAEKAVQLAIQRNTLTKQVREGTVAEGFFKSMEDAGRNAATAFEQGQQVFQSVMGNMESAIDNFVKTGKFAFKDFAKSVIQDLLAIQMKALAMKMITSMFGMGGGGTTLSQFDYAKISGYADGGEPAVGKMSLVGERGPELFVPKTAGTIIPNNRLADALGGGTTNVTNNYINAIDTKSFEDRLLGSSNAIWAANQYAGKNLATNYGRT